MPVHTGSLQIDQAHAALARAVSQSPALCNLWRLEDSSAPERAASYRFVFASHEVDPNTGVDYSQLVGKRFDECFPTVEDTELPATMAACLRDGVPVTLPELHYQDQQIDESWWQITLHKLADDLVGTVALNISAQRRAEAERDQALAGLEATLDQVQSKSETILQHAAIGIALVDQEGHPAEVNPALEKILGYRAAELRSKVFTEFTHPDDAGLDWDLYGELVAGTRDSYNIEKRYLCKDGSLIHADLTVSAVRDEEGVMQYAVGMVQDITARKEAEDRISQQAEEILELSTPVMEVWPGVVLAPLIGVLDSDRTERFMEVLLTAIATRSARVALVDITGVPTVDTQTAQNLIEAVTAARLLGARVVLTGVRPSIAQILVHLGIDLSHVETRASLAGGLALALGPNGTADIQSNAGPQSCEETTA